MSMGSADRPGRHFGDAAEAQFAHVLKSQRGDLQHFMFGTVVIGYKGAVKELRGARQGGKVSGNETSGQGFGGSDHEAMLKETLLAF